MQCRFKHTTALNDEVQCTSQGEPGLRNYCEAHFTELWWTDSLPADSNMDGPPQDLRAMTDGDWGFTIIAEVANTNFLKESTSYTLNKLARAQLRKLPGVSKHVNRVPPRPAPNGAGHTWIRLSTDQLTVSIGHAAGGIMTPDTSENNLTNVNMHFLAVQYSINRRQKDAICDVVTRWLVGHLTGGEERYDIMSSNCTLFARECCKAAGVEFPGNRIPTYSSNGIGMVYTPNNLYSKLEKSTYSFDPSAQNPTIAVPLGRDPVNLPL